MYPFKKLTFIAGPCVIESEEIVLRTAERLKKLSVPLVFKASYDKANRSSIHSFRGVGLDEGLRILEKVRRETGLPITSDVHSPEEARAAGAVLDIVQIPAFLCRQTDLLIAAAESGAIVNVKKGQFLAPWDMKNVVEKLRSAGNDKIILTERGATFGYNNLVSDMRAIPIMQKFGYPVCFDASHSIQLPGGLGERSGGEREFIPHLSKAAIAAGVDLLFIETHPSPGTAKSDASSMLPLDEFERLVPQLVKLYECTRSLEA